MIAMMLCCFMLLCGAEFAQAEGVYFENVTSYRYEVSLDHDEEVLVNKLSANNMFAREYKDISWGVSSFGELRRHFLIER
ncbi:MAG: hypothetical protein ABH825_00955, partial [Candidatus Omnitrophota bacterium]